jgi:hypothetical protein
MLIWFSRILRWALGVLFIVMGIRTGNDGYAISFGAIILLTGFLRPRRCLEEDSCSNDG